MVCMVGPLEIPLTPACDETHLSDGSRPPWLMIALFYAQNMTSDVKNWSWKAHLHHFERPILWAVVGFSACRTGCTSRFIPAC